MKKSLVMLALSATLLLSSCGVESYRRTTVEAKVVDKEHEPSRTTYTTTTRTVKGKKVKTIQTNIKSEEWEVDIKYDTFKKEFKSYKLYTSVDEGDIIKVTLVEGLDKDGKVVSRDIELIK